MKENMKYNFMTIDTLVSLAIILSLLGLGDTLFLAIKHYQGAPVTCIILEGCDVVTTSSYSVVWGIPLAVFGVAYYASLFAMLLFFSVKKANIIFQLTLGAAILGFLVSCYLTYLQVFVIGAICVYCVFSAMLTTLVLVLLFLVIKKKAYQHE